MSVILISNVAGKVPTVSQLLTSDTGLGYNRKDALFYGIKITELGDKSVVCLGESLTPGAGESHERLHSITSSLDHAPADVADYGKLVATHPTTGAIIFKEEQTGFVPYTGATANLDLGAYSLTSPKIIGGSSTTSSLTFQTTTGVGATGADMHFKVGNNGSVEAITILNNSYVGIGKTNPTRQLDVYGVSQFVNSGNMAIYASGQAGYDTIYATNPGSGTNAILGENSGMGNGVSGYSVGGKGILASSYSGTGLYATSTNGYAAIFEKGNVGVGITSPTALLHIKAGIATAGKAPLKFTGGTNLTFPEAGAMEFDGTKLYFTPSGTRKIIAFTSDYVPYTGATSNVDLGVYSITSSTNTIVAIAGTSVSEAGVQGFSTSYYGVYGASPVCGVYGYSAEGIGVKGNSARFGDATNYTDFAADGTLYMAGNATVFDDIQFKISSGKVSATNAPTWSAFGPYLSEYSFATDDFIDLAAEEFVHEWKEGSPVELHIHWATGSTDYIAGDRVQWKVCYSWCNMTTTAPHNSFTNFVNVYVEHVFSTTVTARSHIYSSFGSFTPTGGLIGAQIKVRLYRIAKTAGTNPSSNPYPLQVGMHYQKDTLGSRTTTGK
ncbi:MAG: hypothetical protein ACOYN4_00485 [Bacteroidales bacterium]